MKWSGRDLYEVVSWPEDYFNEVLDLLKEEAEEIEKHRNQTMGGG